MNVTLRSRSYPEFVYVDEWGRVLASSPSAHEHADLIIVDSTNNPESIQAWTVSALYAVVSNRLADRVKLTKPSSRPKWKTALEREIMRNMPHVSKHLAPWTLAAKYPNYPYKVVKDKSAKSTDMPAR